MSQQLCHGDASAAIDVNLIVTRIQFSYIMFGQPQRAELTHTLSISLRLRKLIETATTATHLINLLEQSSEFEEAFWSFCRAQWRESIKGGVPLAAVPLKVQQSNLGVNTIFYTRMPYYA